MTLHAQEDKEQGNVEKKMQIPRPLRWIMKYTLFCVILVILFFIFFSKSGLGYIFFEILLLFGAFWIVSLYPLLIWTAVDFAKRTGRSTKRWGFGAAIGLYLLVFWDQIPTYLLHHYYCATEAGIWVYKTPEQWKAENPGVAETLTWKDLSDEYGDDEKSWFVLNQRFHLVTTVKSAPLLPVSVYIKTVEDIKNEEIVLKHISVYSGYGSNWNIRDLFVGCEACSSGSKEFSVYKQQFKKLGRRVK